MRGAQFVREARKRAGLTQAQLAERAGTTQSAIARIESGRVAPTFERIGELVRACGFELDVHVGVLDDSDWTLASTSLTYPPNRRLEEMLAFRRFARTLRLAGREMRSNRTKRSV
jgi:transcriptional regulator with XRE-family HTH domain